MLIAEYVALHFLSLFKISTRFFIFVQTPGAFPHHGCAMAIVGLLREGFNGWRSWVSSSLYVGPRFDGPISIQIAKLLAQDDFGKKLRKSVKKRFLELWKDNFRLVRLLAKHEKSEIAVKRTKSHVQLLFRFWKLLYEFVKKRRQWSEYVPIAFYRWSFVRRLRLRLGLPLRKKEQTPLQIRKEWRRWVWEEYRRHEERMIKLWLQLGIATLEWNAKLDREIRNNSRKIILEEFMDLPHLEEIEKQIQFKLEREIEKNLQDRIILSETD